MTSTTPSPTLRHQSSESAAEKIQEDISNDGSDRINSEPIVMGPTPDTHHAASAPEWVTGFKLFVVMAAVTLPVVLVLLDQSIIVTAIPRITSDFHSLPDVGWYGAAYMLSSAVLQPLTGKFYSNFSSKWTFMTFFAIFELGSLICGVASSSIMFIIGRSVAGMGSAGLFNGAFTIIAECAPMPKRPALIGFVTGSSQLGLALGPVIGGLFTQYASWRWCFYVNLPIGGLVAGLIGFVPVPEQARKPPFISVIRTLPAKLDLIGFAIFAPSIIQLLLAVQYGGITFAWNSAQVIGLLCGAGGTFIVFLAWEFHKGDAALIPFSMIRQRPVWTSCLTYGFLMSQIFCCSYYLPIYFQAVKGVSPTMSGVYMLPSILTHITFAVSTGMLVGRVGYYLPFGVAGSVLVSISNGLFSTFAPGTSTGKWVGYQLLAGAGRGLAMHIPIIAVQNTLAPSQIPVAMALLMFSQAMGGALVLSFADTIFTNSLKSLIPKYAPSVNAQAVIDAGATGVKSAVHGSEVAGVLLAYSKCVDRVFYLATGAAVASFVFAWFVGFKDVRKKSQVSKA